MNYKKLFKEIENKPHKIIAKKTLDTLKDLDTVNAKLLKCYCNNILQNYKLVEKESKALLKLEIPKNQIPNLYLTYAHALKMNNKWAKALLMLQVGDIKHPSHAFDKPTAEAEKHIKQNWNSKLFAKLHIDRKFEKINPKLPAITLNKYTKVFKNFVATKDVSFTVGHGVIHGFIGPNGSGKTTSIKAMIGAYISEKGQISINGHPAGSANANALIGYIPERASFPKHLNCIDYLSTMGELSGLKNKHAHVKAIKILSNLGLEQHAKRKPISFSSGMQKKILLAQALITDPDILILDEPAANLDPTARKELFDELIKLRKQGKTILLSSHILAELERLINEVTFIYHGKIIFSGLISEIDNSNSDVFIKTSDNHAISQFIKDKHPNYEVAGDLKTEIAVKDLTLIQTKELFQEITRYPKIIIKSLRANDLQSIYDKLVSEAEIQERKEKSIEKTRERVLNQQKRNDSKFRKTRENIQENNALSVVEHRSKTKVRKGKK